MDIEEQTPFRAFHDYRWDEVTCLPYKEEGAAPFKAISRQVLFAEATLGCELRYFEMAAGGYSTLERHEHVHAVMILRGNGQCLVGEEVSLFALCDGETALPIGAAQDHKRVGEGETGPNTGGMGAYSPTPSFSPALQDAAMDGIIRPALAEMARRGTPFRGILYAGLMLTAEGAKLIEFNVRFGDPECQALLPRLMSDLLPALQAAYDGELENFDLRWNDVASIAVVMAARGYPEAPERGSEIRGLDRAAAVPDVQIFHAGTKREGKSVVTNGGRVLCVTALGDSVRMARTRAYEAIDAIRFDGMQYRKDIGHRALKRK